MPQPVNVDNFDKLDNLNPTWTISRVLSWTIISLGLPLPTSSSGGRIGRTSASVDPDSPSRLASDGVYHASRSPWSDPAERGLFTFLPSKTG